MEFSSWNYRHLPESTYYKPLMYYKLTPLFSSKLGIGRQELMSHPKGGEGAFNYVVTALSKVLAVL